MATTEEREYLPAMSMPGLLPLYDTVTRLLGARDAHWQLVAQAGVEPGATVLEIGCGTGNVLLLVARAVPGATVIGLDPDPRALALARRKARRVGAGIRLDRGYADQLPYPDGSVDRVLSSFMFHHLPPDEQQAALREAHRVLAPGGRLHLLDFDGGFPTPPRVVRLVHRGHSHDHVHAVLGNTAPVAVLPALREAGFAAVAESGHGTTLFGGHTFWRAVR
jgi:ubiquinone/menaquinone biosynthesis C-methylase UbiE